MIVKRPDRSVYAGLICGYAVATALYYSIVTALSFTLPHSAVWPMFACTSISAGLSIALAMSWGRTSASPEELERAALSANAVLLFNVVLHTFLVQDAHLLIYFAPLALIFAVIGPTFRVIYASLALTAICAAACGHFMAQAYRSEFAFALVTVIGAALGVATLLHQAIRGKALALAEARAAATALDEARRRSDQLAAEAVAAHAAKARFVANMTHEVRNPLGGMLGLIGSLSRTELNAEQSEVVALLEASGKMLRRIVTDVLDMEKLEAGKVALEVVPLNLSDEIGAVVRLMSAQARDKGLALTFENRDATWSQVLGDPTRIHQILVNLISNAIKFTQEGEVVVRLWTTALSDPARARIIIEVADTGVGFDSENAPWLFERFGQAGGPINREFGGTGLGLAICRALARQMDGDLVATSVLGQGSSFTVTMTLPLAEPDETALHQPTYQRGGRQLRVLVAEDNPANQKLIKLLLDQAAVEIVIVDNGRAAVEARRGADFDVIFMDMHMPELDGLAATKAIRAYERATGTVAAPVVMLTGRSADEDRAAAKSAGADGFVTKPISPNELYTELARVGRSLSAGAQGPGRPAEDGGRNFAHAQSDGPA